MLFPRKLDMMLKIQIPGFGGQVVAAEGETAYLKNA
jgi:hypothetical protein